MMNQYQLQYAVDVLRYLRGEIEATKAMIEHVAEDKEFDFFAERALTAEDFGLTIEQVHEAEDELARLDAMERNDDPGDVGYLRRKYALERM